ncbi:MAG: hypothetical protein IJG84_25215 [Kiritimatiellae bacterium]|nr:hypothetical protein [Kiritimatiellia bacterium]
MRFARELIERLKSNFSTFQLFNLSTRAFAAFAVVAAMAATAANAAAPQDTEVGLGEVGLPVYGADDYSQPEAAYPISAASAPVLAEDQVTATSTRDTQVSWTLAAWTVGRTLSEQKPDAKVGDFCTNLPSDETIDWAKTIAANAALVAEGRLIFDTGTTNALERVLFTASGAVTVKWVKKDNTQEEQTYKIGAMSASRPYRIFATRADEENSAAFIDLSGKFVKFFGSSQLLSSEWQVKSGGMSNVVYGLDYNPSVSKMLTFRYTVDERTGAVRCPQGQFVLAYYDTETKDHMVAHVVVEVCPPAVNTLYAGVGDALTPAGGGYGSSDLYAVVVAGLTREANDPYSPYLEQYKAAEGEEVTDPNHGKVFAIAPTDVTTSPAGLAMPWKADIYWQTTDPMKTRWTFEHDWYLVSWPENPVRVVVAPSDLTPGCPFLVPTNYTVSTMFRMPEDVSATVDQLTGEVSLRGGNHGKILIRLSNDSDTGCPWYIPVEMTDYRDKSVATPWDIDWPVGMEITPRLGIEAGPDARAMSERVDDRLAGYIYEPESPGRNWNPRLYHAPAGSSGMPDMSSAFGDVDGTAADGTDPYAALESSIYAVNASDGKIQVWWRANFQADGMPAPVTYPALVQNYRASWATTMADGLLPEIALSSGLGSADPAMVACGGRSLILAETNSTASVNLAGTKVDGSAESVAAGFAIYVPKDEPATPGRLVRLVFGGKGAPGAATVDAWLERVGTNGWQVAVSATGGESQAIPVEAGRWNVVTMQVPDAAKGRGVAATIGAVEGESGASATYVAIDRLALWYGDTAAPESESDAIFSFSFTDDDLATLGSDGRVRTATDAKGNTLRASDCAALGMGSPKAFSLTLAAEGGVSPEIYYQNTYGAVGFNPNEEHAFLEANGDEYVVWALRNDFNQYGLSEPVVMVMYARSGKGAMQAYRVADANIAHPDFTRAVTVGNPMLPPGPVGKVPDWGTEKDIAVTLSSADDASVVYIDRKKQMWARRDGMALAAYSYPLQPGFYCPSLGDSQLPAGTVVGWMNCTKVPVPSATDIQDGTKSMPWTWLAQWPATNSVPTMRVGQVLTVAENGLPEVWNAASMAVAYPSPSDGLRTVVQLIDPTVAQYSKAELPITANFAEEYGFEVGPSGTAMLRKGKYYFTGLPPSISDRFYIDANADPMFRVCLVGRRVVKESGGSYLQLNVLTDAERTALKAICTLKDTDVHKKNWDKAIDSLAKEEFTPSIQSGRKLYTKAYTTRKTYAFPSQKSFDAWTNKLDSVNFIVSSVKSDLTLEYKLITGPMPAIAGAEYLGATCSWHTARAKWHPMLFSSKETDLAARWAKDGLKDYLNLEWEAENRSESGARGYLEAEMEFTANITDRLPITVYLPRDHYALVANGAGAGWVTLVENDNPDATQVKPGLPVSMKVLRVLPELYVDGIAVLKDPLNKLSEELTLQYRTPLGSASGDFEFEWRRATPASDGTLDTADYERAPWEYYRGAAGLYSILLGAKGARPDEYVNTYYTLRYRAREGTLAALTVGTGWSDWAPEQLAEGWLQRVLNEVTPFAQRVEDFYEKKADSWISMLEEIGRPYQGDVALNNDNLTEVGLLELYQTLFNRAESVLQASGTPSVDLSKQLMLAQTRMGEFYTLLGAEAYSDAKNPLVAQQSLDGREDSTLNLPSSVFCFANQVPTLLDEELALLRGRSASTAYPRMTEAPCYNRLAWNFTKGISEGEPAYVANYGIRARDGVLDVNCAAAQYPQGHGDAWGHYLSVLSGYYRLLRNPLFDWSTAMGEMLMDQKLTNVDYQDEEKFADAVAKLARIGLDAMDLTVRKQYRDNEGETGGYRDSNTDQAFGYGEWATRTGLSAAYGWMTANALLPTNDAPYKAFTDRGIMKIDRMTAAQLPVICDAVRSVENRLAATEAGLNPLGLSDDTIPFDIDPDRLDEKDSHFEQILERAEKALANCKTALDYANKYGNRISMLSREETDLIEEIAEQELAYNNQLIAIYGTPFSGDIGPGGTYPQGYEGPDLYNYNYMDLEPFGLYELSTAFTNSWTLKWGNALGFCDLKIEKDAKGNLYLQGYDLETNLNDLAGGLGVDLSGDTLGALLPYLPATVRKILSGTGKKSVPIEYSLSYNVSEGGIRAKPLLVTGVRATEGSIQAAYRKYLLAYKEVEAASFEVDIKWLVMNEVWSQLKIKLGMHLPQTILSVGYSEVGLGMAIAVKDAALQTAKDTYEHAYKVQTLTAATIPIVAGAGTTVVTSPQAIAEAAQAAGLVAAFTATQEGVNTVRAVKTKLEITKIVSDIALGIYEIANTIYDSIIELRDNLLTAALAYDVAVVLATEKYAALANAEAAYRAEVYKGEMLQDERAVWRRKIASRATMRRYLDMYNRVERNAALAKYSTAFDTAQRYVWELAKVYDYETGLLSTDPQSGKRFLSEIVATRSLGQEGVTVGSATTDGGLYDIVHRMKENWSVLKGRFGINNPDKPEKWFSLRYELFRIRPDESGDAAWRRELKKYWVDDLRSNSDFVRHCQPLESEAVVVKEPGLVIPFSTSINNAENFFGNTLQGGESQFSSADYATKIAAVGVDFVGYDKLTAQTADGLAVEPNVYLVPVGSDYMRAPAGSGRKLVKWNVVDQVLPLPYSIGSTQLDDAFWISSFSGLDGTSDSVATIRRHSTMRTGPDFKSTRLVGRSVWNDRWLLVIPASSLNANRAASLEKFVNGVDDIKIGIKAYSRQGN